MFPGFFFFFFSPENTRKIVFRICSGFDLDDAAHSVRPVRLRCNAGNIQWAYPKGALLIELHPYSTAILRRNGHPVGGSVVCLKMDIPVSTDVLIYAVDLYGDKILTELYPTNKAESHKSKRGRPICFTTDKPGASILVETTANKDPLRRVEINLSYHVELDDSHPGVMKRGQGELPTNIRVVFLRYYNSTYLNYNFRMPTVFRVRNDGRLLFERIR
jgi:hypothetical protein